nr:amidohydrolase family protein [Veronia nyctiphanis]
MTGEGVEEQAIAIKDGHILAIGSNQNILSLADERTKVDSLSGKTLLPGFIDAHSHISQLINLVDVPYLFSQPDGDFSEISEILEAMRAHVTKFDDVKSLAFAWGYDETELLERRHPSLAELNTVSNTQPFCMMQISGNQALCNTKGLTYWEFIKTRPTLKMVILRGLKQEN